MKDLDTQLFISRIDSQLTLFASKMGLALPILLSSILVLILSFLFAPSPKMILGDSLGRIVEIRRSLAKLKLFMDTVSMTSVHPQLDALEYVVQGMQGDHFSSQERLEKVIHLVDDYGWNRGWLMNVGDVKGQILDDGLQLRMSQGDVKVALELGTFMGYSTLRLARKLNDTGAELITIDPDVLAFAVSSSIFNKAGVLNRITMKTDFSQNVFKKLHLACQVQWSRVMFIYLHPGADRKSNWTIPNR